MLTQEVRFLHISDAALNPTHRPLSSSFWGLPYRILNINHKQELLRGLRVHPQQALNIHTWSYMLIWMIPHAFYCP